MSARSAAMNASRTIASSSVYVLATHWRTRPCCLKNTIPGSTTPSASMKLMSTTFSKLSGSDHSRADTAAWCLTLALVRRALLLTWEND